MKVLETKVLRGPNYWSITFDKLIVMALDLEELEERPTDTIEGFAEGLEKMLPDLYYDRCSIGKPGGFFQRVRKGTWMGHVIEHVALELQTLAEMRCGFGRTRGTGKKGIYNVVYEYQFEEAGIYAGQAAIRICEALINKKDYDLEHDIKELIKIKDKNFQGLSTGSLIEEAEKRYIPWVDLDDFIIFGTGVKQKRIQATIASTTAYMGIELTGNKDVTKNLLKKFFIPVPEGLTVSNETDLYRALDKVGYPVVVKPLNGNHGRGISTDINSKEDALAAFKLAQNISKTVIIEKFVKGEDYRLLVVNYKFIGAIKRIPPYVKGNGKSTIKQLIEEINAENRRQERPGNILGKIEIDELTLSILKKHHYSLDSVLEDGEILNVKDAANVSSGGMPVDITEQVHPYNVLQAERMARIVGLDICGLDIISPDISVPLNQNGAAVVEVNAAPGIRMHIQPAEGKSRNAARAIMDMLFPKKTDHSIPLIAITGTNGKTTTTRIMAQLARAAGYRTGYTSTDGIYIDGHMMEKGDCSGPKSARNVLRDPSVEFAVLECARGGIIREGLGFDSCDVAIVTNVEADHLGLKGIDTLEDLAKVKCVVPETVKRSGYAILNADDDLVYRMKDNIDCKTAFFSIQHDNERIRSHKAEGGLCAVLEKDQLVIYDGEKKFNLGSFNEIPLTFGGKAMFMVQNILPAALAAYVSKIDIEVIKKVLADFSASPENTPGRMNFFDFKDFNIMVDYFHNPAGINAIGKFLKLHNAPYNIGIIAAAGDRRDEDIIEVGKIAGELFDEIIIRTDVDPRGRSEGDVERLLEEGVRLSNKKMKTHHIPDEEDSLKHAIQIAKEGCLITLSSETVMGAVEIIKRLKEDYLKKNKISSPVI